MDWCSRLKRLCIGDSIREGTTCVSRIASNRFEIRTDCGTVFAGGKNYSLRLAIAEALRLLGQSAVMPCARCDQPRVATSYCRQHFNAIHAENKRRRKCS